MKRLNPRLSALPLALTIGFLAAGSGSSALAGFIPNPQVSYTGSNGLSGAGDPGTFTKTSCDPQNLCQTTTVGISYDSSSFRKGSITATGISNDFPDPRAESQVSASLTFWFGVFGSDNGLVPLVVAGESAATATVFHPGLRATSLASMNIDVPGLIRLPSLLLSCFDTFIPLECAGTSFASGSFPIFVQPNVIGLDMASVTLFAGGFAKGGTFIAVIDPTIDFAPGFDSTGLTLMFSATPVSAVPEPGTLPLLALGIAVLLYTARSASCRRSDIYST